MKINLKINVFIHISTHFPCFPLPSPRWWEKIQDRWFIFAGFQTRVHSYIPTSPSPTPSPFLSWLPSWQHKELDPGIRSLAETIEFTSLALLMNSNNYWMPELEQEYIGRREREGRREGQVLFFSYCSWGSQGKNTEMVCHSLLQWATFCQLSAMTHCLRWPYTSWLIVSLS